MHKMQFSRLRDVKHVKIINDMNKIIYVVMAVLGLSSCANSFNIDGTSSISNLDGQKLYLKVFTDTTFKDLDSCDVLHGKFKFSGEVSAYINGGGTNEARKMTIVIYLQSEIETAE